VVGFERLFWTEDPFDKNGGHGTPERHERNDGRQSKRNERHMKSNQQKADANRKADQDDLLARLETDREERKAKRKA
jgi:hypothetical protein